MQVNTIACVIDKHIKFQTSKYLIPLGYLRGLGELQKQKTEMF